MQFLVFQLLSTFGVDLEPPSRGDDAPTHQANQSLGSSSTADPSHSAPMPGSWPVSPITNPSPSGFFAGSNNVIASHSVFTEIAGDLNIKIEMKI
jgi:hypothetical protein